MAHQGALPAEFNAVGRTRHVRHDLTRPGRLPRRFGIPNPLAAYEASNVVAANWPALDAKIRTSRFSTTIPAPRRCRRAFEWSLSWRQRQLRSAETRAAARYLVRADISLFYPSVYTHTTPWVLHGKAVAKANPQDMALFGNQLDRAFRNAQAGQTVGIPIGPDWPYVAAELLLSEVDQRIAAEFPDVSGHRLIDDYEFGCASEPEAERLLAALRFALGDYELSLNNEKTKIVDAPTSFFDSWRSDIRNFRFRTRPASQHDDLLDSFDKAAELSRLHRSSAILKFAVGRLPYVQLAQSNWPLVQYLLFQAVLAEPDCIGAT